MMIDLNLKNCPFCGGIASVHDCGEYSETGMIKLSDKWGIHCTQCGVATLPNSNLKELEKIWNNRVKDGN